MRKILILFIVFLLGILFATQVLAVESGGKVELLISGVLQEDSSFDSEIMGSLNLELFLPRIGNNEVRYEFKVIKPLQDLFSENEAIYFTKKFYLRYRAEHFHLTLGRQPVSWSFGSLLNPVDYTLGAVTLDGESNSKYTDALEVYIPVNWNSSLTAVLSFPKGFTTESEKMKWGVRGRLGIQGYDLTLNYVQEAKVQGQTAGIPNPNFTVTSVIPGRRFGLTVKGDIGEVGVYGALGYYFDEGIDSSKSYLLGADYGYNVDYDTKVSMQLEYLGVEPNSLALTERISLLKMEHDDKRLDLLIGRISYPLDHFSSASLVTMVNLDDSSLFLIPSYQTTLPGNLDLTLSGSVFWGKENGLLAPGDLLPQASIAISISYPF